MARITYAEAKRAVGPDRNWRKASKETGVSVTRIRDAIEYGPTSITEAIAECPMLQMLTSKPMKINGSEI